MDYLSHKQYREAVIEFKVAAQNMPKDPEPVYELGMTYLNANATKAAYETFQKTLALDPKHPGARYQMALFQVGSTNLKIVQEAKSALTTYNIAHPGDAEAMGGLALAEAKLGNGPAALKWLTAAIGRDPSNMRPAALVIAFYAASGEIATAQQIARDLADRMPNSSDAAVLRAQVSLAAHDSADADAQISRALNLKSDSRPALELRLRRELSLNDRAAAEATSRLLAKLPQDQDISSYGRMLFAERKIDEGIAEFNRILKDHGDDLALCDQYSMLLLSAGKRQEAAAVISATLTKDPKDKSALLQRTTMEIDDGNLNAASKDARTLQNMKAFSPGLSYQMFRIADARGEKIQAGDLLAESLKANPRYLNARLELARVLMRSDKPKDALTILEQASAHDKTMADYAFYHNAALMGVGRWDEARKNVDAALASLRTPAFLYQDALLRAHAKDMPGARKSLEAGFALNPSDPLILSMLGNLMRQQGAVHEYVALLQGAAAKNPGSSLLQNALGTQLASLGDRDGARAAFEHAKADGDVYNADAEVALLDSQAGDLGKARQRLLDAVKVRDSARLRMLLAEIETRQNASADLVVGDYLKALELEPANVGAMNNLAEVLALRQHKFDDALFWAQKAMATEPGNPAVLDTLGWIYFSQSKYTEALPYLEKSLRTLDRPVAHYHLAAELVKAGDPSRGRREFELAVKQDPKNPLRATVGPVVGSK